MRPRRKFNSGEVPEAGQVWQWPDDCVFYLIKRSSDRYEREGEMWMAINSTRGTVEEVFFSATDRHILWKRVQ